MVKLDNASLSSVPNTVWNFNASSREHHVCAYVRSWHFWCTFEKSSCLCDEGKFHVPFIFIPTFMNNHLFPQKLRNLPTHLLGGCKSFQKFEYPIFWDFYPIIAILILLHITFSFQPETVLFLIISGYSENRAVSYNALKHHFHEQRLSFPD